MSRNPTTVMYFSGEKEMNLRIAIKVLKRADACPRLRIRASRRFQKWLRRYRINRDVANNPQPSDLQLSKFRSRECQPLRELRQLWKIELQANRGQ